MKKFLPYLFCSLLLSILLLLTAQSSAEDTTETVSAREISLKARDKQFPKNSVMDITMILINKRGSKRERTILSKRRDEENGEAKSAAYFLSPADVKGTGFLVWEHKDQPNDIWIYLPALKKIRRIASEQKHQSFMGSDFSYADMENEDVDDADHKIISEETVEGMDCWVVESIPKPESDSEYSKLVTWVRKKDYIPQQVDFYNKKGKHFKHMKSLRIAPVGEEMLPTHISMENIQKKHKTEIILSNIKLDQDIPDEEFTKRAIQRGGR